MGSGYDFRLTTHYFPLTTPCHELGYILTVQIVLEPGGYNGDTIVAIRSRNSLTYETDWLGKDYTRFPQRIRAAATALYYCQFQGLFRIIHKDGMLVIQAIQSKVSR